LERQPARLGSRRRGEGRAAPLTNLQKSQALRFDGARCSRSAGCRSCVHLSTSTEGALTRDAECADSETVAGSARAAMSQSTAESRLPRNGGNWASPLRYSSVSWSRSRLPPVLRRASRPVGRSRFTPKGLRPLALLLLDRWDRRGSHPVGVMPARDAPKKLHIARRPTGI